MYKVFDKYWENVCKISGPVPHGHSGAAVFEVEINNHSKISDMTDINDGRTWMRKKPAKKEFQGCSDHTRFEIKQSSSFEKFN